MAFDKHAKQKRKARDGKKDRQHKPKAKAATGWVRDETPAEKAQRLAEAVAEQEAQELAEKAEIAEKARRLELYGGKPHPHDHAFRDIDINFFKRS